MARIGAAADFHEAAVRLREAIYALFHARIENLSPPKESLALLNAWLVFPAPGVELARQGTELIWLPSSLDADPGDLLRPIALSAANLMTSPRAQGPTMCAKPALVRDGRLRKSRKGRASPRKKEKSDASP